VNYNFQTAGVSFKIAANTLGIVNGKLVFGSYTKGFTTKQNSFKSTKFMSHLFYLKEDLSKNCFFENKF